MDCSDRQQRWLDASWLIICGVLSSLWCITAGARLGATFDEPFYLQAGLDCWRTGTSKPLIDKGTAPLPMYVGTAPLYIWERWTGQQLDPVLDAEWMLTLGRIATLPFWWVLLFYAFLGGRQLAGPWGGRLAVALLAAEPTFLGNACLMTADLAVTTCLLAFWVHFRLGRDQTWGWRVGLPSFLYGIALFAKISALPFGLIGMAVIELDRRRPMEARPGGLLAWLKGVWSTLIGAPFRRDAIQIFWLGIAVVFVLCGTDWRPSPSFVKWADTLPDDMAGASMRWLANHLAVFSNAGNALGYQIRVNIKGRDSFLLGTVWPRAIWFYFPVALSIKITLSLLCLPILLVILAPKTLRNWACALALALLAYSMNCRVQSGVRFMLPLLAVAVVGLSAALIQAVREAGPGLKRIALILPAIVGVLWSSWSAAAVWPHGLCYTNEAWGGTADGYRLLCDGNYDWGQGIPELAAWQKDHGPVDVWYFGADPTVGKSHLHLLSIQDFSLRNPEDVRTICAGRYLAVGTTILYGPLSFNPSATGVIDMLRKVRPVGRTTTFLIYDVNDLPSASAQKQEATDLQAIRR